MCFDKRPAGRTLHRPPRFLVLFLGQCVAFTEIARSLEGFPFLMRHRKLQGFAPFGHCPVRQAAIPVALRCTRAALCLLGAHALPASSMIASQISLMTHCNGSSLLQ